MLIDDAHGIGVDENLIEQLRSWGIEFLTEIQVNALTSGIADGTSMVVCAPTSSGKTLVAEIAVYTRLREAKRTIYLVSHKALADQKYEDFQKKFGDLSDKPIATVGLSTGDREEGNYDALLLVATYEKALSLLVSNQIDPNQTLVIADELQIIGEQGRGPDIESLCAIFLQRGIEQFIALTATVENPEELAAWLNCGLTISYSREIDLQQEVWHDGKGYRLIFGQEEGEEFIPNVNPHRLLDVVRQLISEDRGPILVFTESRREASQYADNFSQLCVKTADGIHLAEQLELFSEPTEASEQLSENSEKKIAFHTADLTPQQRQVIESGFLESKIDVCFATSTLAAGVNFPFKTVVFPKLTYQWGGRAGSQITRSDYRNMSGRAGRLSLHEEGFAILLPTNNLELGHANSLILPENDKLKSQLVNLSIRRSVLMLISSGIVDSRSALNTFLECTFYWHQLLENNPAMLEELLLSANHAIDWLLEYEHIEEHEKNLYPTLLGKATSRTGLLPSTATAFIELLNKYSNELESDFDSYATGILYWVCSSEEFCSDNPSRFLVFPDNRPTGSASYVKGRKLLGHFDETNTQLSKCVHALSLYIDGHIERQIRNFSGVSAGNLYRLAIDVSWVLDGLHRISCVSYVNCTQQLSNRLSMLSRRIHWGAPAEILDIIRVAERNRVPGFGRQRAMILLNNGISTFQEVIDYGKDKLLKLLRREERVVPLLHAVSHAIGFDPERLQSSHYKIADELGLKMKVENCYKTFNVEYEDAILKLLETEERWSVKQLDDGKKQNQPDLLLEHDDMRLIIECKTSTKTPALIKKEDAYAVLQKADDYDSSMHRVCLGKPAFDEHCKKKAQASTQITLIEHRIFMEGILRVFAGTVTPKDFINWIAQPGVTEIDRLSGKETYFID
jgi:ATP-dependent DNA helicase